MTRILSNQALSHCQVGCVTKRAIGGGLGISLEGTVDVEDGVEVRITEQ